MRSHATYTIIASFIISFISLAPQANVIIYPAPPGLITSSLFSVQVNGKPVWVEEYTTDMPLNSLPSWFTQNPETCNQQTVHIANISCSGEMQITVSCKKPVSSCTIRPKSRKIESEIKDHEISFSLSGPDNLYIEINNEPALLFFANPVEENPPTPSTPNVIYFPPGVHKPGLIKLQDNQTLYITGGAVVYGRVQGNPENARIAGRGILDGQFESRLVYFEDASNLQVEGIIIRNGRTWHNTLVHCNNVVYQNVKVISFGNSGDGINPLGSRNITIRDCFLRCTDDCIAIKSPNYEHSVHNIHVLNSTMIGYAFADGVTIGFETNGPVIEDVLVKNCDILMAQGGSRVDGHSAFSVICDGPARISNIRYEDIRTEQPLTKLFELNVTDGTKYQDNPPGHIQDVNLKNIAWEVQSPIVLSGFDSDHLVKNITFENCRIMGQKLTSTNHPSFQINPFVKNITFK